MKKIQDYSDLDDDFIKRNEPLIRIAFNKYVYLNEYEDLLQEARIWLLEAKQKHDPSRLKWTTYAKYYLAHMLNNYLNPTQRSKKKTPESYGYSIMNIESMNNKDNFNNASDINSLDEEIELKQFYEHALEYIKDKRAKDILSMHLEGFSDADIGKKYSITKQRVWQIRKNTFDEVKMKIQEEGICL